MSEKKKPSGPILLRDEHGNLDKEHADEVTKELMQKFLTEKRQHEKDESFHVSRTGKRDIVVHLAVTILPEVDGKHVIGEQEKEYNQWCFRLSASMLPMHKAAAIRAFTELFTIGKQALMALGALIE